MRWLGTSALFLALLCGTALAEINSATGGIAGLNNGTLTNGDGSGDAQLAVTALDLALVKQARDLTGAVLAAGANVLPGQEIYFVLYVDNTTSFPVADLRITDLIDESQFTYVSTSLEQTTVASGSNDAAIWAGTWTGLTDGVGGPDDAASAVDTGGPAAEDSITIGAVPGQANTTVNLSGPNLRAYRFRVTVN
ncbi:MAG: hypothetical protein GY716_06220 [bacterium]|nr:hypothetical protein [bacterium]